MRVIESEAYLGYLVYIVGDGKQQQADLNYVGIKALFVLQGVHIKHALIPLLSML